jgi:hypothetical protein
MSMHLNIDYMHISLTILQSDWDIGKTCTVIRSLRVVLSAARSIIASLTPHIHHTVDHMCHPLYIIILQIHYHHLLCVISDIVQSLLYTILSYVVMVYFVVLFFYNNHFSLCIFHIMPLITTYYYICRLLCYFVFSTWVFFYQI